jgi:hypothetical protein
MSEQQQSGVSVHSGGRFLLWLFASIGLLAAIAVIWLVVALDSNFRERPRAEVATEKPGEVLEIGQVSALKGTPWFAIYVKQGIGDRAIGSYSKGYDPRHRNILLLDGRTGESHRLLPDNKRWIMNVNYFPAKAQPGSGDAGAMAAPAMVSGDGDGSSGDAPPAYYVLQLSNTADGAGPVDILVGTLASRKQAVVMKKVDGVEQMWMVSDQQLGMIVRDKKLLYYRVIDIAELKLLDSKKIEIG